MFYLCDDCGVETVFVLLRIDPKEKEGGAAGTIIFFAGIIKV